jgi:2-polyprenyl-3-methyl-5-hydroxy-6-metoxy-1,4-benzoquinol methylase
MPKLNMQSLNQRYYSKHAQAFFDSTVDVDMHSLYEAFLPLVTAEGTILDAGCGSGRDCKAFLEQGFKVDAFDASPELVAKATALINQPVKHAFFQTYHSTHLYDGIWACASLLHVPMDELAAVMAKLVGMLKEDGVCYCSFKLGNEEIERNGRIFTNLNETSFPHYITGLPLSIEKQWRTGDLRPGRENEQWLNVILRKRSK